MSDPNPDSATDHPTVLAAAGSGSFGRGGSVSRCLGASPTWNSCGHGDYGDSGSEQHATFKKTHLLECRHDPAISYKHCLLNFPFSAVKTGMLGIFGSGREVLGEWLQAAPATAPGSGSGPHCINRRRTQFSRDMSKRP